jgi:DNA excision repair protein ERCC-5
MEHDFSAGAVNDHRILTTEELQEYAKQFEGMEDTNISDYSNFDFSSPFFQALPDADRYRILNQARLRSRLRMGYSKEQLDAMFPDRMAFSKFQIERVTRRNELSQRLMNLQGRDHDVLFGRVAGEKNKEYVMVRNEKEGGWAMTFVGNKGELEGEKSKPIDVEKLGKESEAKEEDSDEDVEFEDVPIEGLNRLPRAPPPRMLPPELARLQNDEAAQLRRALYESRLEQSGRKPPAKPKNDALFLGDDMIPGLDRDDMDDLFGGLEDDMETEEDLQKVIAMSMASRGFQPVDNDDQDLQRAIAMSMGGEPPADSGKGKGKAVETPGDWDMNDGDEDSGFQAAMAESMKPQFTKAGGPAQRQGESSGSSTNRLSSKLPGKLDLSNSSSFLFGGASSLSKPLSNLPAKLDLNNNISSLTLGKKLAAAKTPASVPSTKNGKSKAEESKEEEATPLPPWFAGGGIRDIMAEVEQAKVQTVREHQEHHEHRMALKADKDVVDLSSDGDSDVEFIDLKGKVDEVKLAANTDEFAGILGSFPPPPDTVEAMPSIRSEQATPITIAIPKGEDDELPSSGPSSAPENTPTIPESEQVPITIAVPDGSDDELPWSDSEDERDPAARAGATKLPSPPPPPAHSKESPPARQPSPPIGGYSPPPPLDEEPDDFDLSFERDAPTPPPEEITPEEAEDGELLVQMQREAAEHARFAAEISHENNNNRAQNLADYEAELKTLRAQQKKDRRDADEVTQVMIQECQQLLTLFGLPYITAPMEAEAQCAELVKLGLVDGIVTDDSDVFLFGGTRVYRYMFNDKQVVQCYLLSDFEKELSLDQSRLIAAAQLLGSDYTDGIPGIGPVSAIELLAEFASSGGLAGFKEWWTAVQQGTDTADQTSTKFRKKFKKQNAAKIFLPMTFPNPAVEDAYLKPEVDSDPSAFEWGVPDLEGLRVFLMNTLGWSSEYTDRTLLPVVRDMNKKVQEGSQVNITNFFSGATGVGAFAPRVRQQGKSSRLEKAIESLKKKDEGNTGEEKEEETAQKRPMSMREKFAKEMGEGAAEEEGSADEAGPPKKKRKTPAKRKAPAKRGRGKKAT